MHCAQKERDTFPTTYAKDYVWHKNAEFSSSLASSFDAFALTAEDKKAFIDLNAIREIPWEEQLEIIKNLYAQRMKTTYHVSYCKDENIGSQSEDNIDMVDNDTLLTASDRIYSSSPHSKKVLAPVATARRVMGYCRPSRYYTGLSEYQDEFSRAGYNQLIPYRNNRLKQRLSFCSQFQSKH